MTLARHRPATIEDVARLAGVSRAAVSKVLRDAYGVSDAMRERVNAAMAELEYRPRIAARAMRGRTFTIGIELPDLGNQFFTRMVHGAVGALAGTPYQLIIAPAEEGSREGRRAIEALIDRQVDGVIAVSPRVDQPALERIAASAPVVMFGRLDRSERYDAVAGDDVAGTAALMGHLLGLGHERIAHLTLPESDPAGTLPHGVRLREYQRSMAEAGLAEDGLVWRTDEGQDAAYRAVRDALAAGSSATAIFAAHDELAIGALRAIAEAGAGISVAGYDDVRIASHPSVGLTTVHQPGEQMGARAVELLLERLAGRTEPVHEVFETELIVRTSTRPLAR
ncbi:LacI family transcriptional regulator [Microbacterium sp. HD4P20]|uniref:LacI family DNA-binding transcriptional regulator n=1 Tax=Microbacterium sp. HD4P20 TaxID=2864874 RepID=UPI001C63E250|nr:LacI family DNA-binding transcriptional regulator [Microbacterium sp. HD4P20]MCP2635868.1 LacI family transcriptional regulator [Microbacterium sp. HD4P20]